MVNQEAKRSELRHSQEFYRDAQSKARQQAGKNLAGQVSAPFNMEAWSHKSENQYREQWSENPSDKGGFDWTEIFQRYKRDFKALTITLWSEERLVALAVATASATFVNLAFVEADAKADCPLKGDRALIILEAVTCYASAIGRKEIRLNPANDELSEFYRAAGGFALERDRKGVSYLRKEI